MGEKAADRLVYLSRRAYETGSIRLVLRTDAVCDERDTGFQLLCGNETGLELINPGNSLLVSVSRALELEPRLKPLFESESPAKAAAYAYDAQSDAFLPTAMPEDIPTQ